LSKGKKKRVYSRPKNKTKIVRKNPLGAKANYNGK
jgi:hypothetical protein